MVLVKSQLNAFLNARFIRSVEYKLTVHYFLGTMWPAVYPAKYWCIYIYYLLIHDMMEINNKLMHITFGIYLQSRTVIKHKT